MKQYPPSDYSLVQEQLRAVPFNTNFAEAVLRRHVSGRVYADQAEAPATFLIAHPCRMSLLLGLSEEPRFAAELQAYFSNEGRIRSQPELVQAFPPVWEERISALMPGRLVNGLELQRAGTDAAGIKAIAREKMIRWERLNFEFAPEKFAARRHAPLPQGFRIARVGAEGFALWEGTVMPRFFWHDAGEFGRRGTAFAVVRGDEVASLAFSAFALPGRLELGIETRKEYRGMGLATHACVALINHCLEHRLEPVWSCRKGNVGSERTAQTLGFEVTREIPYFALIE